MCLMTVTSSYIQFLTPQLITSVNSYDKHTFISTVRCSFLQPTRRYLIQPPTDSNTVLHPSLKCYSCLKIYFILCNLCFIFIVISMCSTFHFYASDVKQWQGSKRLASLKLIQQLLQNSKELFFSSSSSPARMKIIPPTF